MSRPTSSRFWRRLFALGLGLVAALIVAEIGARLAGLEERWLPDLAYYQGVDVEIHREESGPLLYGLRPGHRASIPVEKAEFVEAETAWWTDPRVIEVNRLGHRGPERERTKPDGVYRIVAFGGSNTFGPAVSNGETWPDALERALASRQDRPIEVWNLGVNGYVTRQKLAQAEAALSASDPDLLIFQIYNTGPRNLLLSEEVDVVDTFRQQPDLYGETLLWSPPQERGLRAWWWAHSELYRAVVIAANRRARVDDQGKYGAPHELLDARAEEDAEQRFLQFLSGLEGSQVPVVILYGAEGPGPEWCERVGVPVIELEHEQDIPDLPGARHIHPGAEVYSWYGETIADHLLAAGCLTGPCSFSPRPSPGGG